ncbi:hypothetical protein [Bosea sp. PAMC 26642]|uniref:hypothetical protein n=1 Tax=Bosea sp. (strain PAMC 26642) TaxID=1792307 RepID=UPI0007706B24|nr:hypothetical protein [Bosea sp. PAMC 26642]AMJ59070.1 hypothetical protein AXW83_01050 [Bosea sp. PAMC 26642]
MMRKVLSASALTAVMLLGSQAAIAGGCRGSACYNLVSTPPVYGSVAETVMTRPEQTEARIVPARYEYVSEQVMLHPERQIPRHQPAQYGTVSETVMVSAGGRRWEVTRDAHGRTVGCWVETPARYAHVQRTVEISPASVSYETIPAVYTQRQRKVMVSATQVVHETIPATYETRQRQVLMTPASRHWARAGY